MAAQPLEMIRMIDIDLSILEDLVADIDLLSLDAHMPHFTFPE